MNGKRQRCVWLREEQWGLLIGLIDASSGEFALIPNQEAKDMLADIRADMRDQLEKV